MNARELALKYVRGYIHGPDEFLAIIDTRFSELLAERDAAKDHSGDATELIAAPETGDEWNPTDEQADKALAEMLPCSYHQEPRTTKEFYRAMWKNGAIAGHRVAKEEKPT